MHKLTKSERNKFETLLDIVNNEMKALIFLNLDDNPSSIHDVKLRIAENHPELLDLPICGRILSPLNRVFYEEKRGLVDKVKIAGKTWHHPEVNGWFITPKGEELQPLVSFAIDFLPTNYGLAAFSVMGFMNSTAGKRRTYSTIKILRSLEQNHDLSVKQLSLITGSKIPKVQNFLDNLAGLKDVDGNEIPFVNPICKEKNSAVNVYKWTGKEFDPADFSLIGSGIVNLVRLISSYGASHYYSALKLLSFSDFSHSASLLRALNKLIEKGYVQSFRVSEMRTYQITPSGRDYVNMCINHLIGAIKDEPKSIRHVMKNQTAYDDLTFAANVYTIQKAALAR